MLFWYFVLVSFYFRPIAGYANLCPNMISTQPQEFEGMLSTVKHEIMHALVSTVYLSSSYLMLIPYNPLYSSNQLVYSFIVYSACRVSQLGSLPFTTMMMGNLWLHALQVAYQHLMKGNVYSLQVCIRFIFRLACSYLLCQLFDIIDTEHCWLLFLLQFGPISVEW